MYFIYALLTAQWFFSPCVFPLNCYNGFYFPSDFSFYDDIVSIYLIIKRLTYHGGCHDLVAEVLTLNAPIWELVLIPAAPLPIQLPACGLEK